MKILIFFGGPSLESGISLNSARSLVDHLFHQDTWTFELIFVSQSLDFYCIDKKWLYCNTTADFEFKVLPSMRLSDENFVDFAAQFDLIYPLIHGSFGEDGQLQEYLESHHLNFVGSSSATCRRAFFKSHALAELTLIDLAPGPFLKMGTQDPKLSVLEDFLKTHQTPNGFIIKPDVGGSSLGVERFKTSDEFLSCLVQHKVLYGAYVVIEPFYTAQEFCITVIQDLDGKARALMPCTIHYESGEFFDFRKKYLPSTKSTWHCPPKCSSSVRDQLRISAERIFNFFQCRHIARFDGWIFPDGKIGFSDINLISGMEQNSLVFMQAAVCGLSHQRLCEHIIKIASQKIVAPTLQPKVTAKPLVKKKKVFIVFGGETAERQVSLMSGSNVWLKLRASSLYEPIPYLLALDHCLYQIAYHHMLYHTIEEIYEHVHYTTHCPSPISLDLQDIKQASFSSSPLTITEFCSYAQKQDAFVFLALHGGEGEDGSWQRRLSEYKIPFNGSYEQGSALGMDKYLTAIMINELQLNHLYALPKILINLNEYPTVRSLEVLMSHFELDQYWIIKPRHDGCSAGIIVLSCFRDLQRYYELIVSEQSVIPAGLFYSQNQPVELPKKAQEFIIERYIQTDRVLSVDGKIHRQQVSGWLELTQTVLEFQGSYHAFEPSLTLSSGAVLSLEEKFQGGTGTNLTPIPFLSEDDRSCLKESLCLAAKALAIYNYARFDLFYHQELKEIIIIEVNTLPALTASTVLFHQALAEEVPYHPTELLELLITRSLLDKAVFYAQDAGNKDNHIEKSSVLMNSEL